MSAPRTVAIVQARMGSSRLPGKVLKPIGDRPMLDIVLERLGQARSLDEVMVATTVEPLDDQIEAYVRSRGQAVFRGSESDVLERYYLAATHREAELVVRITSDCPLVDPAVVDRVVDALVAKGGDYAANFLERRTYPRGLETEAMTFAALKRAHEQDRDPATREHVTPFIYRNPDKFHLVAVVGEEDHSGHRWTVDTPEDLELVRRVFTELAPGGGWREVLQIVEAHPEWEALNQHIQQKVVP